MWYSHSLTIFLYHFLVFTSNSGGAAIKPVLLNQLRLHHEETSFHGVFSLTLQASSGASSAGSAPTPTDVKGPFHLPPENVPDGFPQRTTACVQHPACKTGGICERNKYDSGLPLKLNVSVTSTTGQQLPGAVVDIWQADPNGVYWKDDDHWDGRRRLDDDGNHRFNCRAHGVANTQGIVEFSTYLPGHYVAGSAWRPRHIHIRASAADHVGVVTQIYFGGDPYLGDKDTACSACKSDDAMLVVPLSLHNGTRFIRVGQGDTFSLADLETIASVPILSPSSTSSSSMSPSPSSATIVIVGGTTLALLAPSSSLMVPSESQPFFISPSAENKMTSIQSEESASTSSSVRSACVLSLCVLACMTLI